MRFDLSICIVLYNPDFDELSNTLDALSLTMARLGSRRATKLYLIDNSSVSELSKFQHPLFSSVTLETIYGQGNVGFGRANNLALAKDLGEYHLVLNPDVEIALNGLNETFAFMELHPDCVLLSPAATYPDGRKQYLCKQYPSLFDLFLRGFAPLRLRNLFQKRLARYEMQQQTQNDVYWNPPIISGCFMFFRADAFKRLKGFDPRYLLYFEDFDISLRANKIGKVAYVPSVQIIHAGGNAARKGWWHIRQFSKSAMQFFASHGVKLF